MMSADLQEVLSRLENLSVEELLMVQESLTKGVRQKLQMPNSLMNSAQPTSPLVIPGAYQLTSQQVESVLSLIMTPQELAQMGTTNFRHKDIGAKSVSQILIEDRADRI